MLIKYSLLCASHYLGLLCFSIFIFQNNGKIDNMLLFLLFYLSISYFYASIAYTFNLKNSRLNLYFFGFKFKSIDIVNVKRIQYFFIFDFLSMKNFIFYIPFVPFSLNYVLVEYKGNYLQYALLFSPLTNFSQIEKYKQIKQILEAQSTSFSDLK